MIRIETMQGSLARRGFVDPVAAQQIIEPWPDEYEPLLDVIATSADPDLALMGVDRLSERVPGLLARLTAAPVLGRQLIMVLGGSNKLSHHLIAHPEHLELLETELVKIPAASLRRELLEATGADPESPAPIATDPAATSCALPTAARCFASPPAISARPSPSKSSTTSPTSCPIWPTPLSRQPCPSLGSSLAKTPCKPGWL